MLNYMKNMLIGLFVVIACGLFVGIILFLEPSVGDGKETLIVRFSNINGISVGTRVMFAGKPIGEVVKIEQIPHAREQPTDEIGQVYFYQLILHVDSSVHVYNTDEITVQTSGLLGEKSIAIIPKAPPKGVKPKLITSKTPVYAESVDSLESAMNEVSQLTDKMEETLDKIIGWIDQNGFELGMAVRSFDDTMTQASIMLSDINQLGVIENANKSILQFDNLMQDASYLAEQAIDGRVVPNLSETLDNLKYASRDFDKIVHQIASGQGSIGKLVFDDNTYLQVNAILSKVNTLMNDVNHYGVFFNLNKQWQRSREKRATMLTALNSADKFKTYFTEEVDSINTSMSRLSMLIEKAQNDGDVKDSPLFKKDFKELLERTKTLLDNLKLYNEQLEDAKGE
jgi:phospholipid/cholesterol/gamma-HCH transport system substrate-binding protein